MLAAAVVSAVAMANSAQAGVVVTATEVFFDPTNANANILLTNGWHAYVLTATVAGANLNPIATVDFSDPAPPAGKGPARGLFGTFAQNWNPDPDDNTVTVPSPTGAIPSKLALSTQIDSRISNFSAFGPTGSPNPTIEDNLHNNGTGSNTLNPIPDSGGADRGVGTFIKHATPLTANNPTTVDFAYIISRGGTINIIGAFVQVGGEETLINQNLVVAGVPEPASLGVLAMGGLALLARRRKAAK